MKKHIFSAFLLLISAGWGVCALFFAAVVTDWVEHDLFNIEPDVTSFLPLAFAPLVVVLAFGAFCIGFFGVKYAAVLTCKYIKIWRCKFNLTN